MSAQRVIRKQFELNYGLDLRSSDLVSTPGGCIELLNAEPIEGDHVKRVGAQFAGSWNHQLRNAGLGLTLGRQVISVHNHTRALANAGSQQVPKEELIAIEAIVDPLSPTQAAHELVPYIETNQTVSYSGGSPQASISFLQNGTSWTLIVKENNAAVLTRNYAEGFGYSGSPLQTMLSDIDGLANFAVTGTPWTNEAFLHPGAVGPIPETSLLAGATKVLTYYMRRTEEFDTDMSRLVYLDPAGTGLLPDISGVFWPQKKNRWLPQPITIGSITYIPTGTFLVRYDGLRACRAGVFAIKISAITEVAGATFATGQVYTYIAQVRRFDATGLEVIGAYSDYTATASTRTVVAGATNLNVAFTFPVALGVSLGADHGQRTAIVNGNQAGVVVITVGNVPDFRMLVSDTLYFLDRATGAFVTARITAHTPTTITIDKIVRVDTGAGLATVNVNNGDVISNNYRIEIYRTKNGGTDFFKAGEIPLNLNGGNSFTDNVTDANLGAAFNFPSRTRALPPQNYSIACAHQGKLILGGNQYDPTAVCWNDDENGIESFNAALATNVPIKDANGVTGIVSDSENKLAVFGFYSHHSLVGDLENLAFNTVESAGSDIGCASHRTLARVGDSVMGLSMRGPFRLRDGIISREISLDIEPDFRKFQMRIADADLRALDYASSEGLLYPELACAINDHRRGLYICFIPSLEGSSDAASIYASPLKTLRPNPQSRAYVLDYEGGTNKWKRWKWPQKQAPIFGFTLFKRRLFWGAAYEILKTGNYMESGEMLCEPQSSTKYDHNDNLDAIDFDIQPQWENAGEPDALKKLTTAKVSCMGNINRNGNFSLQIQFYRNFSTLQVSGIILRTFKDTLTGDITSYDQEKIIDPPVAKCRAARIRIRNNTQSEKAFLTGLSLELSVPFVTKIGDRKG